MKIAVFSDLHLEIEVEASAKKRRYAAARDLKLLDARYEGDADVVVLAGDIHTRRRGPAWVVRTFPVPVIMIAGNHEPYGNSLFADIAAQREAASACGIFPDGTRRVVFLERETWEYETLAGERARFIGATTWVDYGLLGDAQMPRVKSTARAEKNDFRRIKVLDRSTGFRDPRGLTLEDVESFHRLAVDFIRRELENPFDGITVVVTHHAPSARSLHGDYSEGLTPAMYAADLEPLILEHQPDLWLHGHVHRSSDYMIGATRVVCNPRGYFGYEINPEFRWEKVVEVPARSRAAMRP